MLFRVVVEFPALDRFVNAFWRFLDLREEKLQKRVDELAEKLKASNDKLAKGVSESTPTGDAKHGP